MNFVITNVNSYADGKKRKIDVVLEEGTAYTLDPSIYKKSAVKIDGSHYVLFPGFTDVHVHFREPGFCYKETIATGSASAAAGGYTRVCTMPNLNPVPDSIETLNVQLDAIKNDSIIEVAPFASITKKEAGLELSDMEALSEYVAGFSDDGYGVENDNVLEAGMRKAASLGKVVASHCEDMRYSAGGCIAECPLAGRLALKTIDRRSEYKQLARDIALAKKTGCAFHACHISTAESVELIRKAKADGIDISCETAPHYLLLDNSMIGDDGRFKMKPPLGSRRDREALVMGLIDGTIDMISTDHAPHSMEEKAKGLAGSAFGVSGLEAAFPVLYTYLVKRGIISLQKLIELMSYLPDERFFPRQKKDASKSFCLYDLNAKAHIEPETFLSLGKSTPFAGVAVDANCLLTVCNNKIAYMGLDNKDVCEEEDVK